jgi:MFS transporter, SP family, galactose:H+ symporter
MEKAFSPNTAVESGKTRYKTSYIVMICIIAAFGGLLFGLDQGFMNGSLTYIAKDLGLTTSQGASFAAILLWGSVIGALFSGMISRTIGRKNTLLMTAIIFTVFSLLSSFAGNITELSVYRFILGFSVGVASFAVPLYLSEIAPTRLRGAFISMYQMMITVGIFMIFLTNDQIGGESASDWRPMFYAITIPATIMLIGVFMIPKSPRWLMLKKRPKDARKVLDRVRETQAEIETEISDMGNTVQKSGSVLSLFKSNIFLKVLALGIGLQMLQQLSGINAVIYYSSSIFSAAGIPNPTTATVIVGLVNMLTTILAVMFIDKLGRKPIMYFGFTVMILALCTAGYIFHTEAGLQAVGQHLSVGMKNTLLGSTLVYIFAFAISAGPIMWVICAEIFPLKGRDLGMTITTAVNWIFAALVVQFSLPFLAFSNGTPNPAGGAKLFFLFAFCCFIGILVIRFFTPETKGVSLEKMEENLRTGVKLKNIGA